MNINFLILYFMHINQNLLFLYNHYYQLKYFQVSNLYIYNFYYVILLKLIKSKLNIFLLHLQVKIFLFMNLVMIQYLHYNNNLQLYIKINCFKMQNVMLLKNYLYYFLIKFFFLSKQIFLFYFLSNYFYLLFLEQIFFQIFYELL